MTALLVLRIAVILQLNVDISNINIFVIVFHGLINISIVILIFIAYTVAITILMLIIIAVISISTIMISVNIKLIHNITFEIIISLFPIIATFPSSIIINHIWSSHFSHLIYGYFDSLKLSPKHIFMLIHAYDHDCI